MNFMSTLQSPFQKSAGSARGRDGRRIRYEKRLKVLLWIAILGFVFHHHPDDIDQLTA
jgi:hypothetical protein